MSPRLIDLARAALLTAIYVAAGTLGLGLAVLHPSVALVRPATGIALAAVLRRGPRVWPAIFVGAFLVNTTTTGTFLTWLAIAVGNTLEALVAAYLVKTFAPGSIAFFRGRDALMFGGLGGLAGAVVSATVGVTALLLGGFAGWSECGGLWLTWWLGDAVGAFIVAPLFLLWSAAPRVRWPRTQAREGALLALSLVSANLVVFGPWFSIGEALAYLSVVGVVWAAFRFGARETATATAILSVIAITGTLLGSGPFARSTPQESLLLLQAFVGGVAVLGLTFAGVMAGRRRAEAEQERLLHELQVSLDHVKHLHGLLSICAGCKRIRNDHGYWESIEAYVHEHAGVEFTHGLCPTCATQLYPQFKLMID
jgi:integral membrane sensor domain MASE1